MKILEYDYMQHEKIDDFLHIVSNCPTTKLEEIFEGLYGDGKHHSLKWMRIHILKYLIQYYDMQNITTGMKSKFHLLYTILKGDD